MTDNEKQAYAAVRGAYAEDGGKPTPEMAKQCEGGCFVRDSGARTEFPTGAVRDMRDGKGRCDLIPLEVVAIYLQGVMSTRISGVFSAIDMFQKTKDTEHLYSALRIFLKNYPKWKESEATMFLEVAKQFEDGAKKYGDSNWQKGVPIHCYIDSAVRHYLKWLRGDSDEPHDRAFVWNILCCIWENDFSPRAIAAAEEKIFGEVAEPSNEIEEEEV